MRIPSISASRINTRRILLRTYFYKVSKRRGGGARGHVLTLLKIARTKVLGAGFLAIKSLEGAVAGSPPYVVQPRGPPRSGLTSDNRGLGLAQRERSAEYFIVKDCPFEGFGFVEFRDKGEELVGLSTLGR